MHSIQALILEISADKNRPQRKSLSCGLFYLCQITRFYSKIFLYLIDGGCLY